MLEREEAMDGFFHGQLAIAAEAVQVVKEVDACAVAVGKIDRVGIVAHRLHARDSKRLHFFW